jgi:WD40 repeat protein
VLDIAISPDSTRLVTSADDSSLRVWDLETFELISEFTVTPGGFWSLSFLSDGKSVVAGDLLGELIVFDTASGQTTMRFDGTKSRGSRTAVSPDDRFVVAGADGNVVRLWSIETGQIVSEASGHSAKVNSVEFFPDGSRFVSGSDDGTAIIWTLG